MSVNDGPWRGDVWLAELEPVVGYEQGGTRPVLIVSVDGFNQSGGQLVLAVPVTRTRRNIRTQVAIEPPEGGLVFPSTIMCEQVRALSHQRLRKRLGVIGAITLAAVELRLRRQFGL